VQNHADLFVDDCEVQITRRPWSKDYQLHPILWLPQLMCSS